jgi:hypothetical protein
MRNEFHELFTDVVIVLSLPENKQLWQFSLGAAKYSLSSALSKWGIGARCP